MLSKTEKGQKSQYLKTTAKKWDTSFSDCKVIGTASKLTATWTVNVGMKVEIQI